MALGDIIRDDVKQLIATVWWTHLRDGWVAKEIQAEVAKQVQDKWPGRYRPGWPGLRAVQNKIGEIREEYKKMQASGLDDLWHLGTLARYPMPSEAIPVILAINYSISMGDFGIFFSKPLTIRQAVWISRLYGVISDNKLLNQISWIYSLLEKVAELSHTNFDTIEYDRLLSEPKKIPDILWDKIGVWARDTKIFMIKDGKQ